MVPARWSIGLPPGSARTRATPTAGFRLTAPSFTGVSRLFRCGRRAALRPRFAAFPWRDAASQARLRGAALRARRAMSWSPESWRSCEARQQPPYPDPGALAAATRQRPLIRRSSRSRRSRRRVHRGGGVEPGDADMADCYHTHCDLLAQPRAGDGSGRAGRRYVEMRDRLDAAVLAGGSCRAGPAAAGRARSRAPPAARGAIREFGAPRGITICSVSPSVELPLTHKKLKRPNG